MICLEADGGRFEAARMLFANLNQMNWKSFLPHVAFLTAAGLFGPFAFGQPASAGIRGIAWNSDGRPLAEARISVRSATGGADLSLTTGADGMFFIDNLSPGKYQVTASKADFLSSSASQELKASQTVHVDLTLAPAPQPPRNRFLRKLTRILHIKPT